jgi:hypothetical protein
MGTIPHLPGAAEDGVKVFVGDRDVAAARWSGHLGLVLGLLVAGGALAIGPGWRLS